MYLLIGSHNFSSANMLANVIQDFKLAVLAGQPTGEPANDYGELIFLQLPNTCFTFTTSTKQFIRANGNTKDTNPVIPHLFVEESELPTTDCLMGFIKSHLATSLLFWKSNPNNITNPLLRAGK